MTCPNSDNNLFVRLPAPWTSRTGAAGVVASLACLPLGGCILVGGGHNFESRDQMTLTEAAGARKLVLRNQVGDVTVTAEPSATEITATAIMIGRGRDQRNADEALAQIVVTLDPSRTDPGVVEARVDAFSPSNRMSYSVEWRITAPPNVEVEIHNDVGDIDVSGFSGPAFVGSSVGDVNASEMTHGITIVCGVGDVDAKAGGPITIRTDVGDTEVHVLEGTASEISITTNVGEISLSLPQQWSGTFRADTDTGDVDLSLAGMPLRMTKDRDQHAEGTIGEGGPAIVLSADVGDIEVRRARTN